MNGLPYDFTEFFNELLSNIPIDRIGLIRADSDFCNEAIMHQLEEEPLNCFCNEPGVL